MENKIFEYQILEKGTEVLVNTQQFNQNLYKKTLLILGDDRDKCYVDENGAYEGLEYTIGVFYKIDAKIRGINAKPIDTIKLHFDFVKPKEYS